MKVAIFLLSVVLYLPLSAQQIDTLALKKEIDALHNLESIQQYLDRIYEEDQQYRGAQSIDSLDYRHLLSMSYFVNKFGYPKSQQFGRSAYAAWLIWVHTRHHALARSSFPIILKGFLSNELPASELRSYYLASLYHEKFDDNAHLELPLKTLFERCEVVTADQIDISRMVAEKQAINAFEQLPIRRADYYQADGSSRNYELNGHTIPVRFDGEQLKLFQLEDGRIFLLVVTIDGSAEPRELMETPDGRFVIKNRQSNKYYRIQGEELLLFADEALLKRYPKISIAPE